MRTWPTSPPRSGEQDEEEEDDKAPLSPTSSSSRDYHGGGGGGIRSPLLHARTSWQKFVKRRGVSKKRSSTSYDLKHVNSLERRSFSPASPSSNRTDKTFLFRGDGSTSHATPTREECDLPLLYASSPSSSSDTTSTVTTLISSSPVVHAMDDAERRWNSLQGNLNEADIASVIGGIRDLRNLDFADLVRTLEYKENELMAIRRQIRHRYHGRGISSSNGSSIHRDHEERGGGGGGMLVPSSPQSSHGTKSSRHSDADSRAVVPVEQEEGERDSFGLEEKKVEEQHHGLIPKQSPYTTESCEMLEHRLNALWPQTEELPKPSLSRPKTTSWSDSDTLNDSDKNGGPDSPGRKDAMGGDLFGNLPSAQGYNFDVWGAAPEPAADDDEGSIVFEATQEVDDKQGKANTTKSQNWGRNISYGEGCVGGEYTLGIRAQHHMPPPEDPDDSADPFALEERSEDSMLGLYREALKKTTSLGTWGCHMGMTMSEAVSSYANHLCAPVEPTNRTPHSRRRESLFDAMSSSSYSSSSFHNFAEFKALEQEEEKRKQIVEQHKRRAQSHVLAGQHESIDFGNAEPYSSSNEPQTRMNGSVPQSPSRSLQEWPNPILSADSSLNLEALLGATPMAGPGEHFSSASPSAGLTTISKPFGESFDHNSFDRLTSSSPVYNRRTSTPSPPRRPGKPPKPLTSPSLARQRTRPRVRKTQY